MSRRKKPKRRNRFEERARHVIDQTLLIRCDGCQAVYIERDVLGRNCPRCNHEAGRMLA